MKKFFTFFERVVCLENDKLIIMINIFLSLRIF